MDEQGLRRAKQGMISAVTKQQAELGVSTPIAFVERFVAPILDTMDRQASPEVVQPDTLVGYMAGAQPRKPEPVTPEVLMGKIIKALWSRPEWAFKLSQARELCKAHYLGGVQPGCASCVRREYAFKQVLVQAYNAFGNPWRKRDRRIQIGWK